MNIAAGTLKIHASVSPAGVNQIEFSDATADHFCVTGGTLNVYVYGTAESGDMPAQQFAGTYFSKNNGTGFSSVTESGNSHYSSAGVTVSYGADVSTVALRQTSAPVFLPPPPAGRAPAQPAPLKAFPGNLPGEFHTLDALSRETASVLDAVWQDLSWLATDWTRLPLPAA